MDSQTYRSLVESYRSVYDNELNEESKRFSAFRANKEAAERRMAQARENNERTKKQQEKDKNTRSSLERMFNSSPSSKGGDGSGPGSKSHTAKEKAKADEAKAKSDKYFKDAAAKYNRSGGGNRELNQRDIRRDTGTSMGLGRVKSKEEEDKKKNVKEEYRKQRILESLRRAGLRQYK